MSHAASKRENLEALEDYLLTGHYTPTELAERLECTRATIHNYLNELRETHELINEEGKYHLDPLQYVENVRLTQFEAVALYLALRRFIRQTSVSPSFFLSAIQKISNALRLSDLVVGIMQSSDSLEPQRIASSEQEKVWKLLVQAWIERIPVRLDYQKGRSSGYEVETYEFDPYLFEPAVLGYGTYVLGWSSNRKALRTFKVDRIQHVSLLTGNFARREELSPDVLLRHAWEVWYGEDLVEVQLRFAPEVVPRVQETVWHPLQKISSNDDGSVIWSVKVVQWLELVPWIRGWGHEVEVIAPKNLRATIADSMRLAAALYTEEE